MLIQGDVLLDEMGFTLENNSILQEEVSVVFHCAATQILEAKLKNSVEMNARGTRRAHDLVRGKTQLKVCLREGLSKVNLMYLISLHCCLKRHYFFS